MKLLRKLPNSVREAPGLEWFVLKKLPQALLPGTIIPLLISLANRVIPYRGEVTEVAGQIKFIDINSIAIVVTVWTAVLTVAIGCFVVVMIKGSGYVADACEPVDAETPGR